MRASSPLRVNLCWFRLLRAAVGRFAVHNPLAAAGERAGVDAIQERYLMHLRGAERQESGAEKADRVQPISIDTIYVHSFI